MIETIDKMKRQAKEWEKVFEKHISDRGLQPKYKKKIQHLKLHNKKAKKSLKNG